MEVEELDSRLSIMFKADEAGGGVRSSFGWSHVRNEGSAGSLLLADTSFMSLSPSASTVWLLFRGPCSLVFPSSGSPLGVRLPGPFFGAGGAALGLDDGSELDGRFRFLDIEWRECTMCFARDLYPEWWRSQRRKLEQGVVRMRAPA